METLIPITDNPFNAETPVSALESEVTPSDLIYVRNHFDVPAIDMQDWALEVTGAVDNPRSWHLREIMNLPGHEQVVTLECAGNGRTGMNPPPAGTPWGYGAVSFIECTGTPLVNLLREAGVAAEAVEAVLVGADAGEVPPGKREAFARSLPLREALNPDTMLVWTINGKPLSPEHGYPLRLVVPGWYGMASVKWLREIRLIKTRFTGYFQTQEYVYEGDESVPDGQPVAQIRTRSMITFPVDGAEITRAATTIRGVAWSGDQSILEVLVSTDRGVSWDKAALLPPSSIFGGWQWRFEWTPEQPGSFDILSRAFDSGGGSQPLSHRWNRFGYGNNGVQGINITVI